VSDTFTWKEKMPTRLIDLVDDPYYCGFKARVPEFASSQQHTSSQPQQQNNNNTKELNGYKV
jgi:hypothetical protein